MVTSRSSGPGSRPRWWVVVAIGMVVAMLGLTSGIGSAEARTGARGAAALGSCTSPAWNAGSFYAQGDVVRHNDHEWRATMGLWPGVEPGVGAAPPYWDPWTDVGTCTPSAPLEVAARYAATGPFAVTNRTVTIPGASAPIVLTYPTNLGADGVDHPILTYATGTGTPAQDSQPIYNHFASWGFVVAGIGSPGLFAEAQEADDMRAAADYLVSENGSPSSMFSGKLAPTSIGVFGHSQGAAATLLTMGSSRNADGRFRAAVPLALPDRAYWAGSTTPDYGRISQPIFFASGASDFMTSQSEQTFFYNQVPGPATKGAVVGADHGGMIIPSFGYVTAWFRYILQGDSFARRAFVGSPPEMSVDSVWTNVSSKGLS
jgi:hypothetical protein